MALSAPLWPNPHADPTICVSVVSHGQGELVDRLLGDLASLPAGEVTRVVVTVNVPGDAWAPIERGTGMALEVVRNAQALGFAANHNQAFARCREGLFAVVNPDIRLGADPFPTLARQLEGAADCVLAAPVQTDAAGLRETFARRLPTPWNVSLRRLLPGRWKSQDRERRPQWVAGAFMLWRSTAFRDLGGFDRRYRLYCEDVDICLRLQLAGKRFAVVESACVVHDARRASGRSLPLLLVHVSSLLRLWSSRVFWRYVLSRSLARPLLA